jgi:hypothetical protein
MAAFLRTSKQIDQASKLLVLINDRGSKTGVPAIV